MYLVSCLKPRAIYWSSSSKSISSCKAELLDVLCSLVYSNSSKITKEGFYMDFPSNVPLNILSGKAYVQFTQEIWPAISSSLTYA